MLLILFSSIFYLNNNFLINLDSGRTYLTLLYCYIISRYAQLLDAAAESLIQIWRQISSNAKQHANDYRAKYGLFNFR